MFAPSFFYTLESVHPCGWKKGRSLPLGDKVHPREAKFTLRGNWGQLMLLKTDLSCFTTARQLSSPLFFKEPVQGCQIFLGTTYQNGVKMIKLPQTIPNCHKTYQMVVKYSKWAQNVWTFSMYSKALQNIPKWGFLVWKSTIWQPWSREEEELLPPEMAANRSNVVHCLDFRQFSDTMGLFFAVLLPYPLLSCLSTKFGSSLCSCLPTLGSATRWACEKISSKMCHSPSFAQIIPTFYSRKK
jgi:hypothetical protein